VENKKSLGKEIKGDKQMKVQGKERDGRRNGYPSKTGIFLLLKNQ